MIDPELCEHQQTVLRKRFDSAGRPRVCTQCLDCGGYGRGGATAKPFSLLAEKNKSIGELKLFDEEALEASDEYVRLKARVETLKARQQWRTEGDPHYQSQEWRDIRAKVFRRSGGKCEGCGDASATQAHHLSYMNFGSEFLWEVVAICDACHDKTHHYQSEEDEQIREATAKMEALAKKEVLK